MTKQQKDLKGKDVTDTVQPEVRVSGGYVIAPGKAVTSKRGILSDGDGVTPLDFANVDVMKSLIDKKYIVKDKSWA